MTNPEGKLDFFEFYELPSTDHDIEIQLSMASRFKVMEDEIAQLRSHNRALVSFVADSIPGLKELAEEYSCFGSDGDVWKQRLEMAEALVETPAAQVAMAEQAVLHTAVPWWKDVLEIAPGADMYESTPTDKHLRAIRGLEAARKEANP